MIGQAEQSIKDLVQELRDNLEANMEILAKFPNQNVFGISEIRANTIHSRRYICKLVNEYICPHCDELHGDGELVPYYKDSYHLECFVERFGQEKADRVLEAHKEYMILVEKGRQAALDNQ